MIIQAKIPELKFIDRILSLCGIVAPVLLLCAVLIAGSLHTDYSHVSQAISELGAQGAPYNIILNFGGLVPSGILTFLFSLAMFRHIKGGLELYISCGLVALAGLGRLFAGIFPCDPGCLPILTSSGKLHAIFGGIALLTGSVAPLMMAVGLRLQYSKVLFYLSLVLGIVTIIVFIVLASRLWMPYFGEIQRVLIISTYTWIIAVAISIGALGNKAAMLLGDISKEIK